MELVELVQKYSSTGHHTLAKALLVEIECLYKEFIICNSVKGVSCTTPKLIQLFKNAKQNHGAAS